MNMDESNKVKVMEQSEVVMINVADITAIGCDYIHNEVVDVGMVDLASVNQVISKSLTVISELYNNNGSIFAQGAQYLTFLNALMKESPVVPLDKFWEWANACQVEMQELHDSTMVKETDKTRKSNIAFAFVDGVVYITPILVYGDPDMECAEVSSMVVDGISNVIAARMGELQSAAGVSSEEAKEALKTLTGISDREEGGKPDVRGLMLISDVPSQLYLETHIPPFESQVIVGVVLREWSEQEVVPETEEQAIALNALEMVESAAVTVFKNMQWECGELM